MATSSKKDFQGAVGLGGWEEGKGEGCSRKQSEKGSQPGPRRSPTAQRLSGARRPQGRPAIPHTRDIIARRLGGNRPAWQCGRSSPLLLWLSKGAGGLLKPIGVLNIAFWCFCSQVSPLHSADHDTAGLSNLETPWALFMTGTWGCFPELFPGETAQQADAVCACR